MVYINLWGMLFPTHKYTLGNVIRLVFFYCQLFTASSRLTTQPTLNSTSAYLIFWVLHSKHTWDLAIAKALPATSGGAWLYIAKLCIPGCHSALPRVVFHPTHCYFIFIWSCRFSLLLSLIMFCYL